MNKPMLEPKGTSHEFDRRVSQYMQSRGVTRREAVIAVVHDDPALHQQYIEHVNEGRTK